ncbi:aspartate/glutamate racemase family protein [Streptomyces niveiscabiei]|uniref:aspartate/glutamate racemase family protein n=1 Tax=Streptomyces niveiscabiei TaxID=164115 RepID=UPI0029A73F59|nr:aspartate/glutamate racemase family protein [Streptomyces niveiscabiei]MDX3382345.1 aspartate/glutamate racemase family protein [Streptomyces niveiscabiei]
MRLALLHTSPVHIPVFDALRDEHHPDLTLRHHVDETLLARARAEGPAAVAPAVRDALERAVAEGVDAVLCTCSSIGGVAEEQGAGLAVPVVRVDRPMAAEAVAAGDKVVVLGTVASTLGPTAALVGEEAGGRPVTVRTVLAEGAWELFEAGDAQGYARAVADAVDAVTGADAIVLAQASMAPAQGLARTAVPVFSSPRPGLAAAAARCAGDVFETTSTR